MRLIAIILSLFFYLNSFSQNLRNELKIEYQMYEKSNYSTTFPTVLYVRDSATIYQTKITELKHWEEANVKDELPFVTSTAKKVKDGYLKINHSTKQLLSFELLPTNSILVTDYYPELGWKLTGETKKIHDFSCVKATTSYRGRNWIAWFTPEIAVPYGPWKLHGLPGLILEAYSEDEKFLIKVVKVESDSSDIFNVDFKILRTTHNKEPITYRQFLADREEAFDNIDKKMKSQGYDVQSVTPVRRGLELKYEWEE